MPLEAFAVPSDQWPAPQHGKRRAFWDDVAESVAKGTTVVIKGASRQSIDRALRLRGVPFETSVSPGYGIYVRKPK